MPQNDELRMILLGSTGSGISSTGNTILQKPVFKTMRSAKSVTVIRKTGELDLEKHRDQTSMGWKKIIVYDNPGFFCTELSHETLFEQIRRSFVHSNPGPHAFIYVVKIGRLPSEEEVSIKTFLDLFGENVLPYVLVVFTHKNELDGTPLDQYISTLPKTIREFTSKSGLGCIAIENKTNGEQHFQQMRQILQIINDSVKSKMEPYFPVGELQLLFFDKRKANISHKLPTFPFKFQKKLLLRLALGLFVGSFVLYLISKLF